MLAAKPWDLRHAVARGRLSDYGIGDMAACALVVLLTGLYTVIMWRTFPAARWNTGSDFVYASWQMSKGVWLYRDVLGERTDSAHLPHRRYMERMGASL